MKKLIVINVLPEPTYRDCHIKNSINVPLDTLEDYAKKLDKDTHIVVYCASYTCPLSSKAWHKLKNLGFTNVKAYEGGISEWKQKGYPTEGACSFEYLQRKETPQKRDIESIKAEELKELIEKIY